MSVATLATLLGIAGPLGVRLAVHDAEALRMNAMARGVPGALPAPMTDQQGGGPTALLTAALGSLPAAAQPAGVQAGTRHFGLLTSRATLLTCWSQLSCVFWIMVVRVWFLIGATAYSVMVSVYVWTVVVSMG